MSDLTEEGRRALDTIARRHGVSVDAAATLLRALAIGDGRMAQFSHPELGGMGQWTTGGMVMVGDMFNNALKARVDALCSELAGLLGGAGIFVRPPSGAGHVGGAWWPSGLGAPAAVGAQNDLRYAYFPASRRLAVSHGGQMQMFDTGDHRISGVGQQQGAGQSLVFTSQSGPVRLDDLAPVDAPPPPAAGPVAPGPAAPGPAAPGPAAPGPAAPGPAVPGPAVPGPATAAAAYPSAPAAPPPSPSAAVDDPLARLERLAELHHRGIVTDEEFAAKKAELLRRI